MSDQMAEWEAALEKLNAPQWEWTDGTRNDFIRVAREAMSWLIVQIGEAEAEVERLRGENKYLSDTAVEQQTKLMDEADTLRLQLRARVAELEEIITSGKSDYMKDRIEADRIVDDLRLQLSEAEAEVELIADWFSVWGYSAEVTASAWDELSVLLHPERLPEPPVGE